MRKLPSVTKHKPEINSGAADEIALAGGCVKEPVGFQDEMHPAGQGVFDADERGDGHECVFPIRGGAVVEGVVAGGVLEGGHVLHSAASDGDAGEGKPFAEWEDSVD